MSWIHLNDTRPKARKDHVCTLCGRRISKGTVHVARRGVADFEAVTARMHLDCEEVTREWSEDDWDNYWDIDDFREEKERFFRERDKNQAPKMRPNTDALAEEWS